MCAISNYVSGARRLVDGLPRMSPLAEALSGIDEASQRAAGIIRHLRDLTKQRKQASDPFSLKTAVDECIRTVLASSQGGVRFVHRIMPDVQLKADRIMIQQVIINLLTNASDAVQQTARKVVTISAREEADALIVSVADTGPGLSPEAAESVFSWVGSSKREGMGLGFPICRTIVGMHNGKIWLEKSDADGSDFCFSLPLNV